MFCITKNSWSFEDEVDNENLKVHNQRARRCPFLTEEKHRQREAGVISNLLHKKKSLSSEKSDRTKAEGVPKLLKN